jgi:uncharacterized protein (DUF1330 family)
MSVYIIANVAVTDPARYESYKKLSSQAIAAHGAEVCVRGGAAEVLKGVWQPDRLVVLKFRDVVAARACYDSPEHAGDDAHDPRRRGGLMPLSSGDIKPFPGPCRTGRSQDNMKEVHA